MQASQQLAYCPTHALPPLGALQRAALPTMLHVVLPLRLVRQHDTAPGRPHDDLLAQRVTLARQDDGRAAVATCCFTTSRAQRR